MGVTHGEDLSVIHQDQRIGPAHLLQGLDNTIEDIISTRLRHQMEDHLRIGAGAKDRATRL